MYCVVGFNLQVQRCKVQGKLDMTGGFYSGFGFKFELQDVKSRLLT